MNTIAMEKMQELATNPDFIQRIETAENESELSTILKEYGVDASLDDVLRFLENATASEIELDEDMLDNVAGGGKIWDWIKKSFKKWFEKKSKKNAEDIEEILKMCV